MQSRFLHIDDTKTWDAFRAGNQAAFAYIYQTFFQELYNYGRRFSKDNALISDTLQQLFTELWQRRRRLGSTNQIKNYLYKSFRRSLLRNQAKKSKTTNSSASLPFDVSLSYEAKLIQQQHSQEQLVVLQEAITQLTEKQREVIYLKFYNGLAYAEIGEIMDISAAQVYDFMYKALRSLRKNVKRGGNYGELTSSALVIFFIGNTCLFLL